MPEFAQRLEWIREAAFGKRGRSDFARALGIPLTSYLNYEKGRVPPMDTVVKMMALTRVNPRWLVHGKGRRYLAKDVELHEPDDAARLLAGLLEENRRLKDELQAVKRAAKPCAMVIPAGQDAKERAERQRQIEAVATEHTPVPILSAEAAANLPKSVAETDREGWVLCPGPAIRHPNATFALRVEDDAMSPDVPEGSLVGVDTSVRDPRRFHGTANRLVGVRGTRGICVIRRMEKAGEHWLFLPMNPSRKHAPIVWTADAGEACPMVGKVVFVFTSY